MTYNMLMGTLNPTHSLTHSFTLTRSHSLTHSFSGLRWGLTPSEPGFNSRWYRHESLVAAGRASSQNRSRAPVEVLPILVGIYEPLNKGVGDVKFGQTFLAEI